MKPCALCNFLFRENVVEYSYSPPTAEKEVQEDHKFKVNLEWNFLNRLSLEL